MRTVVPHRSRKAEDKRQQQLRMPSELYPWGWDAVPRPFRVAISLVVGLTNVHGGGDKRMPHFYTALFGFGLAYHAWTKLQMRISHSNSNVAPPLSVPPSLVFFLMALIGLFGLMVWLTLYPLGFMKWLLYLKGIRDINFKLVLLAMATLHFFTAFVLEVTDWGRGGGVEEGSRRTLCPKNGEEGSGEKLVILYHNCVDS